MRDGSDGSIHDLLIRTLLESTAEGVYGLDASGRLVYANPAAARILGYEADELIGKDLHDLVHHTRPDGTPYPRSECPLLRALETGVAVRMDTQVLFRHDGSTFAGEVSAYPMAKDGAVVGLAGTLTDVSVRRRAEEAVRKTHGVLQAVIEGTTDAVTVTDVEGRYLLINAAGARFLGQDPEAVLGRDATAFYSADSARALREGDKRIISEDETRTFEETLTVGDNTWTFLSTKGPYRDHRGQVIGVIAISRDITERKRMEATLRLQASALQLLQTIAISANEAATVEDAVRGALARLCAYAGFQFGCALQRRHPKAPLEFLACHLGTAPAEGEAIAKLGAELDLSARALARGKPEWVPDLEGISDRPRAQEARRLGARGAFALPVEVGGEAQAVLLLFSSQPIEPDPPLIVVLSNAAAQLALVVQRKRGEETLRASEERSRLILETATDAFIGIDDAGRITEWNRQAVETFGRSRADAIGRSLVETLVAPRSPHAAALRSLLSTGSGPMLGNRLELTAVRSDGHEFPAELTLWSAPGGGSQRWNAFVHDITERKRAEEALRTANEKLTSWVGELERRNREVSLLNEMGDLLQSCLAAEEAHAVIAQFGQQLFPDESGALYVTVPGRPALEVVRTWGEAPPPERVLGVEDCWSLRRGRVHAVGAGPAAGPRCKHVPPETESPSLCVPLMAQGEALGMLYLEEERAEGPAADHATEAKRHLALTVGEHISLSLANFKLRETLREQSIRDPLTGLYNRRYMEESLDRELRRAERKGRTLGLLLADVDHFKQYNDQLGHEAGDALLRALAEFLKAQVRREDIVCRYGGEEFTLLLPEASLEIARERADMLCERVRALRVEHRGELLNAVTLSVGVSLYPEHGATAEDLFRAADVALYRAKSSGRNRVEIARLRDATIPKSDPGGRPRQLG